MASAVQSRAAGKQTEAIRNLADILFGSAGCSNGARAALFPHVNITLCVECYNTLPGCSGCGMNSDTVLQRYTEQSIWIRVAQIHLTQKRKLMQIIH